MMGVELSVEGAPFVGGKACSADADQLHSRFYVAFASPFIINARRCAISPALSNSFSATTPQQAAASDSGKIADPARFAHAAAR